jgi:general secretion pathway protein N
MRLMRRAPLLLVLLFAVALIAGFPLRALVGLAGLGDLGLTARAAEGSIWRGKLVDAEIGGVALGNVAVRIAPLALLTGKARLILRGQGDRPLAGSVFAGLGGFGADVGAVTLPLGGMLAPLPPASLSLSDVRFGFAAGRCTAAEGQVRLTFEAAPQGLDLGKSLAGSGRCDGDAVATTLVGASGLEKIMFRIRPDGHYVATIIVSGSDVQAGTALRALGFRETAAGYVRRVEGAF